MRGWKSPDRYKKNQFLQRFEGKWNIIGKPGLIQMGEGDFIKQKKKIPIDILNQEKRAVQLSEKNLKYSDRKNKSERVQRQSKLQKKTNHSNRTLLRKKLQSKQLAQISIAKEQKKLPIIRSSSTKSEVRLQNLSKINKSLKTKRGKKPSYKGIDYRTQIKLDKYAIKYMSYLDEFEEKLKKLDKLKIK